MVVQFVGFMGGWQHPQDYLHYSQLPPVHLLRGSHSRLVFFGFSSADLTSRDCAASSVTSALRNHSRSGRRGRESAVWFGLNASFETVSLDWFALALALVALIGMLR
jgi:hypothetical protein